MILLQKGIQLVGSPAVRRQPHSSPGRSEESGSALVPPVGAVVPGAWLCSWAQPARATGCAPGFGSCQQGAPLEAGKGPKLSVKA